MVKYLIFFFNFIFVIAGILLITAGALSYVGYDKYLDIAKEVDLDAYKAPPILMMVIGSIVFIIAFLGCCGAMQESNCMMMTYAAVLAILLIAEVSIAIVAAVKKDDFEGYLKEGFLKSMKKYSLNDDPLMESWNSMQQNLKCCGVEDYKDWGQTSWTTRENVVPKSCCRTVTEGCSDRVIYQSPEEATNTIYTEGCLTLALNDIGVKYLLIGAAVVAGVELLGIIFACCLAGRFRRKHYAV
jgi:CD63 antigen